MAVDTFADRVVARVASARHRPFDACLWQPLLAADPELGFPRSPLCSTRARSDRRCNARGRVASRLRSFEQDLSLIADSWSLGCRGSRGKHRTSCGLRTVGVGAASILVTDYVVISCLNLRWLAGEDSNPHKQIQRCTPAIRSHPVSSGIILSCRGLAVCSVRSRPVSSGLVRRGGQATDKMECGIVSGRDKWSRPAQPRTHGNRLCLTDQA